MHSEQRKPRPSSQQTKFTDPAIQVGSLHFFVYDNSASARPSGEVGLPYCTYIRSRTKWIEDTYWFDSSKEADRSLLASIYNLALKRNYISELPPFLNTYK